LRYELRFLARKETDFDWQTEEIFQLDSLLELIFKFQICVTQEMNRIVDKSKQLGIPNDDIPF